MTHWWARFYMDPDPAVPNKDELEDVEVPWDADAINELLDEAWPGGGWITDNGRMSVALSLGMNKHGTYELSLRRMSDNKAGYLWCTLSALPTPVAIVPVSSDEDEDEDEDPVTNALMSDALKTHGLDSCPKCGSRRLHMFRLALRCDRCLTYVGGL